MIIITSYKSPDIDGIACSIGYVDLLASQGKQAEAHYSEELGMEVGFVRDFTGEFPVKKHDGPYPDDVSFVLVDTSDPGELNPAIPLDKVIEIYDHRKVNHAHLFPKATAHMEQVGSCSTLIAEELKKHELKPSKTTAIYLYSAIVSNTINFKNSLTTQRDKKMSEWLLRIAKLPLNYVEQMFRSKSSVSAENIKNVLDQDLFVKEMYGHRIGITQLEIVDLEKTVNELKSTIDSALKDFMKTYKLDVMLFSGIDVMEGYNVFFVIDTESNRLFSAVLGEKNLIQPVRTASVRMRKEIIPLIDEYFRPWR